MRLHRCYHRTPPLTRPEVALSLLVEVAYEHDEELRPHLPQVCCVWVWMGGCLV